MTITIYKIEKDRNILAIYTQGREKPYKYDFTTGDFIGLRGQPIKTIPNFSFTHSDDPKMNKYFFLTQGILLGIQDNTYKIKYVPQLETYYSDSLIDLIPEYDRRYQSYSFNQFYLLLAKNSTNKELFNLFRQYHLMFDRQTGDYFLTFTRFIDPEIRKYFKALSDRQYINLIRSLTRLYIDDYEIKELDEKEFILFVKIIINSIKNYELPTAEEVSHLLDYCKDVDYSSYLNPERGGKNKCKNM